MCVVFQSKRETYKSYLSCYFKSLTDSMCSKQVSAQLWALTTLLNNFRQHTPFFTNNLDLLYFHKYCPITFT